MFHAVFVHRESICAHEATSDVQSSWHVWTYTLDHSETQRFKTWKSSVMSYFACMLQHAADPKNPYAELICSSAGVGGGEQLRLEVIIVQTTWLKQTFQAPTTNFLGYVNLHAVSYS